MDESIEQAPVAPPGRPRKRVSRRASVCLAVLAIVIIGSSLFLLLHSRSSASIVVKRPATPTRAVSGTPTLVLPTPTRLPYLAMFYDAFANNFHGWSLSGNAPYYRIMTNNTLILSDTNPNSTLVEPVPTLTNLDNYALSVDFVVNQSASSDGIGVYVRGDNPLFHDYRVDVNGDNTLDLAKEYLDTQQASQSQLLVEPQPSPYLKPAGQPNTLTVFLIGNQLIIEINNIVVMSTTDRTYPNGQIALFARHGAASSGVTVTFSRVEIDRLASPFFPPPPTPTPSPSPGATAAQE